MTTGNSVADYKVMHTECPSCNGHGIIASRNRLRDVLHDSGLNFKSRRIMVREFKRYGDIACDNCSGTGKIEEWY